MYCLTAFCWAQTSHSRRCLVRPSMGSMSRCHYTLLSESVWQRTWTSVTNRFYVNDIISIAFSQSSDKRSSLSVCRSVSRPVPPERPCWHSVGVAQSGHKCRWFRNTNSQCVITGKIFHWNLISRCGDDYKCSETSTIKSFQKSLVKAHVDETPFPQSRFN